MPQYRDRLPQLDADLFLTDGGIETTLIFDDGFDLPDFAAFPLLDDDAGRAALQRYFDPTSTSPAATGRHRAGDADLAGQPRLGRPPGLRRPPPDAVNRDAVDLLVEARHAGSDPARRSSSAAASAHAATATSPDAIMTAEEAQRLPRPAGAGVRRRRGGPGHRHHDDLRRRGDRRHPRRAARRTCPSSSPSPSRPTAACRPARRSARRSRRSTRRPVGTPPTTWSTAPTRPTSSMRSSPTPRGRQRIRGVRANASRLSHAELDEAEELDSGDPRELAQNYLDLASKLPQLARARRLLRYDARARLRDQPRVRRPLGPPKIQSWTSL